MEGSYVGLRSSYRPGYVAVSPLTMHASVNKQSGQKNDGGRQMLLSFPATRAILWDRRPLADAVIMHPTHYRNPSLILEEKTLRLAHRFAQQSTSDSYICYLLATVTSDSDGQGLCVTVDRFESNSKVSEGCLDSAVIPCLVRKNSAKPKTSAEDYGEAIQNVCTRCYSKSKVDVQHFVAMKAYCSYHENQQTFLFHLDFTLVTCGVRFKATPVRPVPVVPTALSKNLSGPRSMSGLQGEPKTGYLTMDQTRKLLLVLESDPKVDSLPLVGIWISGVTEITHPFVWASCLRYIFNPCLKERVVLPPEAFLVVLYSPIRSKPEFFECVTTDGSSRLHFNLSACHEVVQLPKDTLTGSGSPYEMEMVTVEHGDKMDAFEAALENNKSLMSPPKAKSSSQVYPDDITPRTGPMPQTPKAPDIQPSVPEVSLLMDENEAHVGPRPVPRPMQMTHASTYPAPNHAKTKKETAKSRANEQPQINPMPPLVNGYPSPAYSGSQANTSQAHVLAQISQNYNVSQQNQAYAVPPYTGGAPTFQGPISQAPVSQSYQPPHVSHPYQFPNAQFAPPPVGYPPYEPQAPYVYPPPASASQPAYANAIYNGAPAPHPSWPQPPVMPPHVHLPAQTQLSASNISPIAPYNNQAMSYPQGYTAPPHPGVIINRANDSTGISLNTSQDPSQVPVLLGQMKSPVLRPVRENSDMEDTEIKVEDSMSATVRASPPRGAERNDSQQNSPEHHTSGSTDSGLHFSDNPDPDVNNTVQSVKSSLASGSIHPDVYELLRLQDAQLKQLREQLSQLLSRQGTEQQSLASEAMSQSSEATLQGNNSESKSSHDMATQMSNHATPVKQLSGHMSKRTCSAAVNTSLFHAEIEQARGDMHNTTEQSVDLGLNFTHTDLVIQAGNITEPNVVITHAQSHDSQVLTSSMTQSPPRVAEDGVGSDDTMSFGNFRSLQIQDRTQDSMVSEMMVDMPAYTSLSPDKRSGSGFTDTDESNRSPLLGESVSMYERKLTEADASMTDLGEQPTNTLLFKDQRQFYQNLMGNVQKLLGNTGMSEDLGIGDTPQQSGRADHPAAPSMGRPEEVTSDTFKGATPGGLNRSLSLPTNADEGPHKGTSANPLRQSYPFHDDVRTSCPMNDDVAEKTRRQLEAMGIHLEKMNPVEKSRMLEHSSFFLDPSLLPKMQYVSMVLESENDVSAEADALAMKYLSDEQLTELAKLRSGSPGKPRRGREFDRILSQTTPMGKSNNSTLYGANHMSFASRKYLERYGLLDSVGGGDVGETTATPKLVLGERDQMTTPSSVRVKDFLQSLQEQSFAENTASPADAHEQNSTQNSSSSYQFAASETRAGDTSEHSTAPTGLPATPMAQPPRQVPGVDRTPLIPSRVPEMVNDRRVFNNSAPHIPTEANMQVFSKTPKPGQRNMEAVVPNNPQQFSDMKGHEPKKSQVENVLDIQRLKELPKLL